MTSKNQLFAAGLAGSFEPSEAASPRGNRAATGVLAGRSNRLAELASGAVVSRTHELVDPARCRMWVGHNRQYDALKEARCTDLIESLKAQGRQEVPAIVRRLRNDPNADFEVICGARRHWSVSWLRAHNYPDFRFLIEVRELTDEEAFRLADLENRARADISDRERARDYLRALDTYYEGRQTLMADRIKVTPSWLSRYLDLARLPMEIVNAFDDAHGLGIKHVTLIKPLLKPEERKRRVFAAAACITQERMTRNVPLSIADTIRRLHAAADAPKKTGSPKRSGFKIPTIHAQSGKPLLVVARQGKSGLTLTLPARSGAARAELDAALASVLDAYWA